MAISKTTGFGNFHNLPKSIPSRGPSKQPQKGPSKQPQKQKNALQYLGLVAYQGPRPGAFSKSTDFSQNGRKKTSIGQTPQGPSIAKTGPSEAKTGPFRPKSKGKNVRFAYMGPMPGAFGKRARRALTGGSKSSLGKQSKPSKTK